MYLFSKNLKEKTMLTRQEVIHTAQELQENYRRLAYPEERVLADTKLSSRQLQRVLQVNGADLRATR